MTPILNHYFARINWSGAAAVNIDTLRALHLKHNCTIPFENLDVLLPREIQLDDQSLEEKLVIARRGGYCFEQNGVFERVLRELGFNVRSLLGRVVLSNPPALPPREASDRQPDRRARGPAPCSGIPRPQADWRRGHPD